MQQRISPASAISGAITLPGDKSISHRYAMISAIADGESRIHNYSTGADCHSTLGCVRALGIEVEVDWHRSGNPGQGSRRTARARCRSRRRQFGLHHPHAERHPGGPALPDTDLRGRVALPPADAAHHAAAGRNGRGDSRARGQVPSARNPRHPTPAHRLHAARTQRTGEDVRPVRRTLRRRPDLGQRAGGVARSHRNRSAGIRRRDQFGAAQDHARRAVRILRAANSWCRAISLRPRSSSWPRCWFPDRSSPSAASA